MIKNNLIETNEMLTVTRSDVEIEFKEVIEKYKHKIKGSNTFITIGLEGTANRGVDLETAKQLFFTMGEYFHYIFS